ncbi:unnamed protein product [Cochlearia groenlandica]
MNVRSLPASKADPMAASLKLLPLGFRFHPTDEELISYYLKKKVLNKARQFDTIGEIDVYKHNPSDLKVHSKLKTRDKQWFFFSAVDKVYSKGSYMKRSTKEGFWKVTGKDREILGGQGDNKPIIGMIKSLSHSHSLQVDAYVLCRLILKDKPGPFTGIIYAPYLEQESDDDEALVMTDHVPVIANNDESLPLCVVNTEAPLPLIQYNKRRNSNTSRRATQDHCSSTVTSVDACVSALLSSLIGCPDKKENPDHCSVTSVDACVSALLSSLIDCPDKKENPVHSKEKETEPVATIPPSPSCSYTEMISEEEPVANTTMAPASSFAVLNNDLQKEKQHTDVERETLEAEMKKADIMINFLHEHLKTLSEENNELRKNNKEH